MVVADGSDNPVIEAAKELNIPIAMRVDAAGCFNLSDKQADISPAGLIMKRWYYIHQAPHHAQSCAATATQYHRLC